MSRQIIFTLVFAIWISPCAYAQEDGPQLLDGPIQLEIEVHNLFRLAGNPRSTFNLPSPYNPPAPPFSPPAPSSPHTNPPAPVGPTTYTEHPWWLDPDPPTLPAPPLSPPPKPSPIPISPPEQPSSPQPTTEVEINYYHVEKIQAWERANENKLKEVYKKDFAEESLYYESPLVKLTQGYSNENTDGFLTDKEKPLFALEPLEMYMKLINDLPSSQECLDYTQKMGSLAYELSKKGYGKYRDDILYVGKETIKLMGKTVPLVAAHDKSVNIWKFTTGYDMKMNRISFQEQLESGSGFLIDLVPYPEAASSWLLKSFHKEVFKDFLRKVAAEEKKE